MPKNPEKKDTPTRNDAGRTGAASPLISRIVADADARAALLQTLETDGPAHKQWYTALLLRRIEALVQALEAKSGASFEAQQGLALAAKDHEAALPVALPKASLPDGVEEAVLADTLAHAPAHEVIAFNALLQGIEWSIAAAS